MEEFDSYAEKLTKRDASEGHCVGLEPQALRRWTGHC